MTIYTKQRKPYRIKKSTIDLRMDGRLDWYAKSIQEANEKRDALRNVLQRDDNEIIDDSQVIPDWVAPKVRHYKWSVNSFLP